jgi:hypothetical protein
MSRKRTWFSTIVMSALCQKCDVTLRDFVTGLRPAADIVVQSSDLADKGTLSGNLRQSFKTPPPADDGKQDKPKLK